MVGGWREQFVPAGFFVLRTPTLPFDTLRDWGRGLEAARAADEGLIDALERDRVKLRERLGEWLARPEVREALLLASPSLFERVGVLGRADVDAEQRAKVELALARYLTRMTFRPTPFGLFAGCTLGGIAKQTRLELGERDAITRHSRLDMDYLCALVDVLQRDPTLRDALLYFPNSSLYRLHERVHYVEWKADRAGRSYELVAADASDYLIATLERAERGARPTELAEGLVRDDPEVTLAEALEFVHALIDSQILTPDLEPRVTGPEPLERIIQQLDGPAPAAAATLREARGRLSALDQAGLGAPAERYAGLVNVLSELPAKPELARLAQVDLTRPARIATLGGAVLEEVARGIQLLRRLTRGEQERVIRFREAFRNRYEAREVALVEALDEEKGIGFDANQTISSDVSPLLQGLEFPPLESASRVLWTQRETHLLRRLCETARSGEQQLELSERDVEAIAVRDPLPIPDAFAAMTRIAAASAEALAAGEFRVSLDLASGPSGAMLLGRFCHGDALLTEKVRAHLRAEEAARPDALFAEIAHLPEGRMGNVLLRPLLREYEIPYQGASGAPREKQIPIHDLYVSVVDDRIVLRSRRLGREIIPRLTSAHNFGRRTLGIYRFLGTLQGQGVAAGMVWNWGALDAAPFLPRVTSGRLVLARARWLIAAAEIKRLTALRGPERFRGLNRWREERGIPPLAVVAEDDNELLIDFENGLACEVFLRQLTGSEAILITEPFPGPNELVVTGPDGRYTNEIIIPFERPAAARPAAAGRSAAAAPATLARDFPPGSEWVYLKLYSGVATCDRLLQRFVGPLVGDALRAGVADRWFFVRYGDPDWHLRVRLHGAPGPLNAWLVRQLEARGDALLRDGLAQRAQLDTYSREIERYGGDLGMEAAERIFHADSDAALAILETTHGGEGAEARWLLSLRSADLLIRDLGFDAAGQGAFAKTLAAGFAKEFRVNAELRRKISERFRRQRETIVAALVEVWDDEHPLAPGFEFLRMRSNAWTATMTELRSLARHGLLQVRLDEFAASLIHMSVNRLLRSAQRAQECVLYHFLERVYASRAARQRE